MEGKAKEREGKVWKNERGKQSEVEREKILRMEGKEKDEVRKRMRREGRMGGENGKREGRKGGKGTAEEDGNERRCRERKGN